MRKRDNNPQAHSKNLKESSGRATHDIFQLTDHPGLIKVKSMDPPYLDEIFGDCQIDDFFTTSMRVSQNNLFVEENDWLNPHQADDNDPFHIENDFKQEGLPATLIPSQSMEEEHPILKPTIGQTTGAKPLKKKKALKKGKKNQQNARSETKNVPKNYGKQIIKFVKDNKQLVERILLTIGSKIEYADLNRDLQKRKKSMSKISNLRSLWVSHPSAKEVRIISEHFLRKHSLQWIFNSRIQKIQYPLKYRKIIMSSLKAPQEFVHLKQP